MENLYKWIKINGQLVFFWSYNKCTLRKLKPKYLTLYFNLILKIFYLNNWSLRLAIKCLIIICWCIWLRSLGGTTFPLYSSTMFLNLTSVQVLKWTFFLNLDIKHQVKEWKAYETTWVFRPQSLGKKRWVYLLHFFGSILVEELLKLSLIRRRAYLNKKILENVNQGLIFKLYRLYIFRYTCFFSKSVFGSGGISILRFLQDGLKVKWNDHTWFNFRLVAINYSEGRADSLWLVLLR